MTLRTNVRLDSLTYWIYFAAGIAALLLARNAPVTAVLSLVVFELTFAVWLITFLGRPASAHRRSVE
jgi:hypothetical protein